MPEPAVVETPKQQTLDDFRGTKSEQVKQKIAFIQKYGLADFETVCVNSSKGQFKK